MVPIRWVFRWTRVRSDIHKLYDSQHSVYLQNCYLGIVWNEVLVEDDSCSYWTTQQIHSLSTCFGFSFLFIFLSSLLSVCNSYVTLSSDGFVFVEELLAHQQFRSYSVEDVERVVATDDKQRFKLCNHTEDGRLQIRANQGHSVQVSVVQKSRKVYNLRYIGLK